LNRAELVYVSGNFFDEPELPSRGDVEGSGIIEGIGSEVDNLAVGQEVSITSNGVIGE